MLISETQGITGPSIQAFDPIQGFRLQDQWIQETLLILPESYQVMAPVPRLANLPWETLWSLLKAQSTELLLIGIGTQAKVPEAALLTLWQTSGHAIEWMQTDAACRTHRVLSQERRTALLLWWEH